MYKKYRKWCVGSNIKANIIVMSHLVGTWKPSTERDGLKSELIPTIMSLVGAYVSPMFT